MKRWKDFTGSQTELTAMFMREAVILDPGEYVCRDVECPSCKGKGFTTRTYQEWNFNRTKQNEIVFNDHCERCGGTGVVPERVG